MAHSSKRSRTTGHRNKERPTTLKSRMASVRARDDAPGLGPLTVHECRDHLDRTLAGTAWGVVRGLHFLRHSMISCLAAAGVDQRVIDDIVGYTQRQHAEAVPAPVAPAQESGGRLGVRLSAAVE